MGLKNYSTKVDSDKTIMEIERILSVHGATDIWKQLDGAGNVIALNFAVNTEFGKLPFQLPSDPESVLQVLVHEKKAGKLKKISYATAQDINHARNVDWRIIRDWVDAQIAMIEKKKMRLEQVFLPYLYNPAENKTLYQALREKKFAGLLMEGKA